MLLDVKYLQTLFQELEDNFNELENKLNTFEREFKELSVKISLVNAEIQWDLS